MAKALRLVEEGKADIAVKRQRLGKPVIDRDDLYEFQFRQEARTHLRSLSANERAAVLAEMEPLYVAAISEGPLSLSRVTADQRAEVIDRFVRTNHQAELDVLAEREEALTALGAAAQIGLAELREHAGLADHSRPNDAATNGQTNGNGGEVLPSFSTRHGDLSSARRLGISCWVGFAYRDAVCKRRTGRPHIPSGGICGGTRRSSLTSAGARSYGHVPAAGSGHPLGFGSASLPRVPGYGAGAPTGARREP